MQTSGERPNHADFPIKLSCQANSPAKSRVVQRNRAINLLAVVSVISGYLPSLQVFFAPIVPDCRQGGGARRGGASPNLVEQPEGNYTDGMKIPTRTVLARR